MGRDIITDVRYPNERVSIHAPRVGRDHIENFNCFGERVSIHAPRVGRDQIASSNAAFQAVFQSTRPAWGATGYPRRYQQEQTGFNPRAPRGARLIHHLFDIVAIVFQSTRPAWGATFACIPCEVLSSVSIHAPRVGRDPLLEIRSQLHGRFNPRAPRGARH